MAEQVSPECLASKLSDGKQELSLEEFEAIKASRCGKEQCDAELQKLRTEVLEEGKSVVGCAFACTRCDLDLPRLQTLRRT